MFLFVFFGFFGQIVGISSFCVFAAFSFAANFVSQFFLFVPLLTFDERRIVAKRNFAIPCIKHENSDMQGQIEMIAKAASTSVDSTPKAKSVDLKISRPLSTTPSMRRATSTQTKKLDKDAKCVEKISMEYFLTCGLVPLLSKRWFRCVLFVLFALMLILSIISMQWIDTETDALTLVPDDSHIIDYDAAVEAGFGSVVFASVQFVVENRDFSEISTRDAVLSMADAFENDFESDSGTLLGEMTEWVVDFDIWMNNTFNISVDSVTDASEFYDYLQSFTNDSEHKEWDKYIIYDDDDNPTKVKATEVCFCVLCGKYIYIHIVNIVSVLLFFFELFSLKCCVNLCNQYLTDGQYLMN